MEGIAICSIVIGAGICVLLWMKWKKREKYQQDAVKIVLITAILSIIVCITSTREQRLSNENQIRRNPAGEGNISQNLQLTVPGILEDYDYEVEIEAEHFEGEALQQLFEAAADEAEQLFLGVNESLDEICTDVALPKKLQEGQIRADWGFQPDKIFDETGRLDSKQVEKTGSLVIVSLTLSYFDEKQTKSFGCLVFPKKISAKEQILEDLGKYFEKEKEHPEREVMYLPEEIDGYALHWSQKPETTYQILLLLGLLSAMLVCMKQKQNEQLRQKKRREKLVQEYPDMVSKLALLLGAGMTLGSAWEKIVLNYQRKRKLGLIEEKIVYEEMLYSYREIQDGIGELKVYERFGERCGSRQYRKFSALLIQNLRKGSTGLTGLLEKEVSEAFELRKNNAKKTGEQAGTKLLLPMVLMLCVVMVIILVPAVMSFQLV